MRVIFGSVHHDLRDDEFKPHLVSEYRSIWIDLKIDRYPERREIVHVRFAHLFCNVCKVHFPDKIVGHQRFGACSEERLRDQVIHALKLAT